MAKQRGKFFRRMVVGLAISVAAATGYVLTAFATMVAKSYSSMLRVLAAAVTEAYAALRPASLLAFNRGEAARWKGAFDNATKTYEAMLDGKKRQLAEQAKQLADQTVQISGMATSLRTALADRDRFQARVVRLVNKLHEAEEPAGPDLRNRERSNTQVIWPTSN